MTMSLPGAPAEQLPPKPLFLKGALIAALAATALYAMSALTGTPMSPARLLSFIQVIVLAALLLVHLNRGDRAALIAYLVLDFSATGLALWNGRWPLDWSVPDGIWLDVVTLPLTVAAWVGLLHPLTTRWFKAVRELRRAAPPLARMAQVLVQFRLALAWAVAAPAMLKIAAYVGAPPQGEVAIASLFLAAGAAIAVTQGLKYRKLRAQQ